MSAAAVPSVRRRPAMLAPVTAAIALIAVLVPQSASRAQAADWVDIPVSVSLEDGDSYFVVLTSADGTIEALKGDTVRSYPYPVADDCESRTLTDGCFVSDVTEFDDGGKIGFQGTGAQVRTALASLRFSVRDGVALDAASIDVSVTVNPDPTRALFFNPDNGHYYEYVEGEVPIEWTSARDAAVALRLALPGGPEGGYVGYLATVTSLKESEFTNDFVEAPNVWIGASDAFAVINAATGATTYVDQDAAEGNWYWVTGPEAGTHFWEPGGSPASQTKGSGGVAVSAGFEAWKDGTEPNDSGAGEHFAILNYNCSGACTATSNWNDFAGDNKNVDSFLAEFGPIDTAVRAALATNISFDIVDLMPPVYVSNLAISCTPDPVVPGGTVTCQVTGGDPDIDILWRASLDGAFAEQGVRLDAQGNGSFSFVAPASAAGRSVSVELVDWGVSDAVAVSGQVLPGRIAAGEGWDGASTGGLLGAGALVALALATRLRARRSSAV